MAVGNDNRSWKDPLHVRVALDKASGGGSEPSPAIVIASPSGQTRTEWRVELTAKVSSSWRHNFVRLVNLRVDLLAVLHSQGEIVTFNWPLGNY